MEIKFKTKYDIGDVLYYANHRMEIENKTITTVVVLQSEDETCVRYYFDDHTCDTEKDMLYYSKDINDVAKMIGEHAIEKFHNAPETL